MVIIVAAVILGYGMMSIIVVIRPTHGNVCIHLCLHYRMRLATWLTWVWKVGLTGPGLSAKCLLRILQCSNEISVAQAQCGKAYKSEIE
jgi:hypothetical protein